jgi:pyrroline-5-carboxylate reductase
MKACFIGGGNMGEALIKSLLANKICAAADITVSDISRPRLDYLQTAYGIKVETGNLKAVKTADVIILAVKPADIEKVAHEIKGKLTAKQLVISIAAGVTMDTICEELGHSRVVRSMPNMPAQIGKGMTVWMHREEVSEAQVKLAHTVLASMGEEIMVNNEKYIDMATAISGSGPAYIFLIVETLTDAGVHIGLTRAMAEKLAIETTIGSAMTIKEMRKHPAELRNMVTSPGGTTSEGLLQLETGGFRSMLLKAVIAGYEKSKKLGSK